MRQLKKQDKKNLILCFPRCANFVFYAQFQSAISSRFKYVVRYVVFRRACLRVSWRSGRMSRGTPALRGSRIRTGPENIETY